MPRTDHWPGLAEGETDRAAAVVRWLDSLQPSGAATMVLWTGTDPLVLLAERDEHRAWQARYFGSSTDGEARAGQQERRRPLREWLRQQRFEGNDAAGRRR
jgi:hypothetical protein